MIVALSILRPARRVDNMDQLARIGVKHAVTCTLVLASFRRLLRQEGAFLHRNVLIPKMSSGGSLHSMKWLPLIHILNWVSNFLQEHGRWGAVASAQKVAIEKVLPLDYSTMLLPPLVGVCSVPVRPNEQVAVLPLQSPILSALRELERTGANMESNVQLRLTRCSCGEYHMFITACRELVKGDVLVPATGGNPQIIVQFDGSAHRTSQVGGAGMAGLKCCYISHLFCDIQHSFLVPPCANICCMPSVVMYVLSSPTRGSKSLGSGTDANVSMYRHYKEFVVGGKRE